MSDFSLRSVRSRPAKVDDKLVTRCFGTRTRGFAAADKEGGDRELDTQRANQARSRAPQGGCIMSFPENRISRRSHVGRNRGRRHADRDDASSGTE